MLTTKVYYQKFSILALLSLLIFSIGCEGGRDDILSLSLYNFSLVEDEESIAGGYTKLYVTIKDPSLNIEIFPNARAAIESKAWDVTWRQSVSAGKSSGKVIPQIIGFDKSAERDTFVKILNKRSADGISWAYQFHNYESEFLLNEFDLSIVYAVEFKPVLPDYDNLTPTQTRLLDIYPPIILDTFPTEFSNVDLKTLEQDGIKVVFDENIIGDLQLIVLDVNANGEIIEIDMNWISNSHENTITLVKGDNSRPLKNGWAYHVSGSIKDMSGNVTDVYYYFKVFF